MTRKIEFANDQYYHIYSRGTEKRKIFLSQRDYKRFFTLLYLCNDTKPLRLDNLRNKKFDDLLKIPRKETLVDLCSYCLMPNHFHLILREKTGFGISKFLQKTLTAYTMYFNIKNERSGTLFEGRFKAKLVDTDEYLKYLISYIHLNPIKIIDPEWKENGIKNKKGAEEFLKTYEYSSYLDYINKKDLKTIW